MRHEFILAGFRLDCEWEGIPPVYRLYVRDELLTEREWRWNDSSLEEILQLDLEPGIYPVKIVPVGKNLARFTVSDHVVTHGPARWTDHDCLEVMP